MIDTVTAVQPSPPIPAHGKPSSRPLMMGLAALAIANLLLIFAAGHAAVGSTVIAALAIVPGWLLMRAIGYQPSSPVGHFVTSVALSLTIVMMVGLTVNTVGPWLGIERPLARWPLAVGLDVALLVLAIASARRVPFGPPPLPSWRQTGFVAACLLVPAAAAAGAARLNTGGSAAIAIFATLAAGGLLVAAIAWAASLSDGAVTFMLCCAAATMVLSFSTRGAYLFGYDIQQEFGTFTHIYHDGVWRPSASGSADDAYRAMLSITVLPAVWAELAGLTPLQVFRVVLPLTLILVPAGLIALLRPYVGRRLAVGVTAIPVLMPQFMSQLPAVTRQAVGLGIFTVLLSVLFDRAASAWTRAIVGGLLGTGLVVSHYTTSYLAVTVLTAAWLVTLVLRLLLRRRTLDHVLSGIAVVWLLGFCLLWNVVITDSVTNVRQVAAGTSSTGLQVLPDRDSQSPIDRWLNATVPPALTPQEYSDLVAAEYRERHPWIDHYDQQLTASTPLAPASVPPAAVALPLAPLLTFISLAASQILILGVVVAVLALLVRSLRGRWDGPVEVAVVGTVALLVTAVGRVSGAAIASYNADRLYLQSLLVFALPLAVLLAPGPERGGERASSPVAHRRSARRQTRPWAEFTMWAVLLALFCNATQMPIAFVGGAPAVNLSNTSEAAERYLYDDTDIAATRWVDRSTPADALIFVDRYGVLPMWNSVGVGRAVFTTLAPSAVDTRGYVVLTHVNIDEGRARGTVGTAMCIYQTPVAFYDARKNIIFSTGHTRVYR